MIAECTVLLPSLSYFASYSRLTSVRLSLISTASRDLCVTVLVRNLELYANRHCP